MYRGIAPAFTKAEFFGKIHSLQQQVETLVFLHTCSQRLHNLKRSLVIRLFASSPFIYKQAHEDDQSSENTAKR